MILPRMLLAAVALVVANAAIAAGAALPAGAPERHAAGAGRVRLDPGPTRPALVLPVYNDRGVAALLGELAEFVDARTTIMVVSGNEQPPFEPTFVTDAVARLHAAFPHARLIVATSGAAHVAEAVETLPSAAEAVVYVFEPNRPNEEFTWDFEAAVRTLEGAGARARSAGVPLFTKPTGRPLLEGALLRHGWDYGRLAGSVPEMYVQTQTYCRQGPVAYATALERLATQVAGARGVHVQLSIGPTFPNGVTPARAAACLGRARPHLDGGTFSGVLVWWSPEALDDVRAFLRVLRPPP